MEPEIILLYTEEKQYTDKDVVKITGLVSAIDSPTALIGIYDPFGMPAGFYFGSIDSNFEFTTSFLVKDGVNFRVDGTYSVKAHYAESEATSFFDYYKVPIVVEDSSENQIDENETVDELIDETIDETIMKQDESIDESTHDADTVNEDINDSKDQTSNSQDDSNSVIESTSNESKLIPKNNIASTKNISEKTLIKKTNDLEIKETKIVKEKISPIKIKKENNLNSGRYRVGKIT